MKQVPFEPLDPGLYRELVRRALAEDLGWGDVTTEATVAGGAAGARHHPGQVAVRHRRPRRRGRGVPAARSRGRRSPCVTATERAARPGDVVAEVRGMAASLLTAERTALNFLQRLSGIATLTRRFVDAAGGRITILDTRKTTPTLRALEKYAVRAGGGTNHRSGLDDGILIKDNHIRLAGGVDGGGARGCRRRDQEMPIEVEAQSLDQVDEALARRRRHHPARQPVDRRHAAKPCGGSPGARRSRSPAASRSSAFPSSPRPARTTSRSARSRTRRRPRTSASSSSPIPLGPERRMSEPLPDDLAAALAASADRRGPFGQPVVFQSTTARPTTSRRRSPKRGAPEGAVALASRRRRAGAARAASGSRRLVPASTCRSSSAARQSPPC